MSGGGFTRPSGGFSYSNIPTLGADGALSIGAGGITTTGPIVTTSSANPAIYASAGQIRSDVAATAFNAPNGGASLGGDLSAVGGFRHVIGTWTRDNVAASLTDSVFNLFTTANTVSRVNMPRAGSVMAITAWFNAAITAGGATAFVATVWKDGSAIAGCALTIDSTGNPTKASVTFAKDTHTFSANEALEIRVTTSGTYAPATLECDVNVEVEC